MSISAVLFLYRKGLDTGIGNLCTGCFKIILMQEDKCKQQEETAKWLLPFLCLTWGRAPPLCPLIKSTKTYQIERAVGWLRALSWTDLWTDVERTCFIMVPY